MTRSTNPAISKVIENPKFSTRALPRIGKHSVVTPRRNMFIEDTKSEALASSSGNLYWTPVKASAGHSAKQKPLANPVKNIPIPIKTGELGRCKRVEGPIRKVRNAIATIAGQVIFLLSHS